MSKTETVTWNGITFTHTEEEWDEICKDFNPDEMSEQAAIEAVTGVKNDYGNSPELKALYQEIVNEWKSDIENAKRVAKNAGVPIALGILKKLLAAQCCLHKKFAFVQ